LLNVNSKALGFQGGRKSKKPLVTLDCPDNLWTFPMALVGSVPVLMLDTPLIMPGGSGWPPVVETKPSAVYAGKILTTKDNFHIFVRN
jgi:hypothetical protein